MLAALALSLLLTATAQPAERIVAIQVQGNTVTPEAEVLKLAALEVGAAADTSSLEAAA